jgi:serine phosphatase RsbU (regulator of sigma subunit)
LFKVFRQLTDGNSANALLVRAEVGLPFGLAGESSYPELKVSLLPGAKLTLVTDGVVEAQDVALELFGFDRVAAISDQSAEAITSTAKQFGQEDDIAVLKLTRPSISDQADMRGRG